MSHLTISSDKIQSFVFPLNRADHSHALTVEGLKVVDLHNRTMFGISQDQQVLQVKQLQHKNDHHSLLHVSAYDFCAHYHARAQNITPLNCHNTVLISLTSVKRYLVYDYVQGVVTKEI